MKLGFTFNKIFSVKDLAEFGFDFLELPMNFLHSMTEEEQDAFLAEMKTYGLTADSCCSFFGKEVVMMGDDIDLSVVEEATLKNLAVAEKFGMKIVVIGSGGARKIPEGYPVEKAKERFASVVRACADICQTKGMKVVIEPLRRSETNFINTALDGLEMKNYIDHPAVGCLVDFFHLYTNEENYDDVKKLGNNLIHAHFARPNPDRLPPKAEDEKTVQNWLQILKDINYDARLVLECSWRNALPDVLGALNEMKPLLPLFK
ncbi:MAG: sugar phosphate isomerase/epimerase [Clostridia bacterium]|nr:sugar phosphate isomerase/epimerase [Clostridia bacterium]